MISQASGLVARSCNRSYSGGWAGTLQVSGQSRKIGKILSPKIRGLGIELHGRGLPGTHKALGSGPHKATRVNE